jgi:high-affinity Fe2+/Pb2+ permease
MSETVTIRVAEKLKEEMGKFDINWSDYLREKIDEKVKELKRRKIADRMDKIRAKTKGKNISMAREVIEWRKRH